MGPTLLGCVFFLLPSLFSLHLSLFFLLLVVVVLRRLDPMRRVTHSTHDKPCQFSCCCSELERLALSALFSLLSSLSALFPLLSLLLICQIALRTCPFDLCIRPSTSPPTASTLCGSIPGPAECAKRLNIITPAPRIFWTHGSAAASAKRTGIRRATGAGRVQSKLNFVDRSFFETWGRAAILAGPVDFQAFLVSLFAYALVARR